MRWIIAAAVGVRDRHRVIGTVQDRAGEIVETGVEQVERVVALLFHRADFGDQVAAFGNQVPAWLDFQPQGVAKLLFEAFPRGVPKREILVEIDVVLPGVVRDRQTATGADGRYAAADFEHGLLECAAHLREMFKIRAGSDVHVDAGDRQAVTVAALQAVPELFVPDAMLRLFAARVRLLAMSVAEARMSRTSSDHRGDGPRVDRACRANRH